MGYTKLVERIGGRRAIVDANLPAVLADRLCMHGVKAVFVEYIKSAMKDSEIASLMGENDVLLTRDYEFYRKMGDRAILLKLGYGVKKHKWHVYCPWISREEAKKKLYASNYGELMAIGMNMMFGKHALEKAWTNAWDRPDFEPNGHKIERPVGKSCDYGTVAKANG